ncbi:MAG: helix-turn-helix domain-containing protein, partial [bacterium]|nr:helix-turn-helix domain-containing protein [bacterium]
MRQRDRVRAQLDKAKAETRERILRDRDRVSDDELKRLLTHIADHLFDAGFSAGQLRADPRFKRKTTDRLCTCYGQTLKEYCQHHKMLGAAELLERTQLKIWRIAEFAGYSSHTFFSRAFRERFGRSPTEFRRERRRVCSGPT